MKVYKVNEIGIKQINDQLEAYSTYGDNLPFTRAQLEKSIWRIQENAGEKQEAEGEFEISGLNTKTGNPYSVSVCDAGFDVEDEIAEEE